MVAPNEKLWWVINGDLLQAAIVQIVETLLNFPRQIKIRRLCFFFTSSQCWSNLQIYLHFAPNLELAKDLENSLQVAIALEVFGLEGRWVLQGVQWQLEKWNTAHRGGTKWNTHLTALYLLTLFLFSTEISGLEFWILLFSRLWSNRGYLWWVSPTHEVNTIQWIVPAWQDCN